jgi:acyl-CoA thioesterase
MLSENIRTKISQDSFASFLGIELLELREGYSKVTLTAREHMLNFHGILHGGVVFSLADTAFGAAANSHGQVAVALNVSINFLAPVPSGARLYAEAVQEKLGRRTAIYRLTVTTQDGDLVALCLGTVYRKSQALWQGQSIECLVR